MRPELQNLDLIDLISERHLQLRRFIEKKWNDTSSIYISNSEWFIMARVYKRKPTISYVAKNVDISRQATHKFVKSLQAKGLIEVKTMENNNRDKCIELTELGVECYEKNLEMKAVLVNRIADKIGIENVSFLKDVLRDDWGL